MTIQSDRWGEWLASAHISLSRRLLMVPSWLQVVVMIALVMGIGLRFTNLDTQVFCDDETYTLLRVAGYTTAEVKERIFTGDMVNQSTLALFQNLKPNSSVGDTIYSLAVEDPQHPPLYYILARFWVEIFGNSVLAIRCLSAIISLAVFPSIYWLCRELFKVPHTVAIITIALVAVSPLHLLFAQAAQEYTLWMMTVLLASAALLRAIRLNQNRTLHYFQCWGLYALGLVVSFYTFIPSVFVAIAHGVYVLFITRFRRSSLTDGYTTAVFVALAAYIPWIVVIINNYDSFYLGTMKTQMSVSRWELILAWFRQIRQIFFDFLMNFNPRYELLITSLCVWLVGYAMYFLVVTKNSHIWFFLVTLIVIPSGILMVPDIAGSGIRSLSPEYMLPSYLAVQITVAYLLAYHIYNGLVARKRIWQLLTVIILVSGLFSEVQIIQSDVWWNKLNNYGNPEIANIINQVERPILISDDQSVNYGNVFSLSYSLEPNTRYQLIQGKEIPRRVNRNNITVFLLNPSSQLKRSVERVYQQPARITYRDRLMILYQLNPR